MTKIITKMSECKTRESSSVAWTCMSNSINQSVLHSYSPVVSFIYRSFSFVFYPLRCSFISFHLTPWIRVLFEELTVAQLVKKFPAFYATLMFITVFKTARHRSLSRARWTVLHPPTCFRKIHFNICALDTTSEWSPPFRFSTKMLYSFLSPSACYVPRPSHAPWFDRPDNIWWRFHTTLPSLSSSLSYPCFLSSVFCSACR
jgi:hypothetical protein